MGLDAGLAGETRKRHAATLPGHSRPINARYALILGTRRDALVTGRIRQDGGVGPTSFISTPTGGGLDNM